MKTRFEVQVGRQWTVVRRLWTIIRVEYKYLELLENYG